MNKDRWHSILPKANPKEARMALRCIGDQVVLSSEATQALTLMWGLADGRRWHEDDVVREMGFSPPQAQAVFDEIQSTFRWYLEGIAEGHLEHPLSS
ncbi:MAG: hypothetical protein RL681_305 [Candidatus Parcubacteria bacterium]|jgi:hypothetical protein